jgi:hypothetical protein
MPAVCGLEIVEASGFVAKQSVRWLSIIAQQFCNCKIAAVLVGPTRCAYSRRRYSHAFAQIPQVVAEASSESPYCGDSNHALSNVANCCTCALSGVGGGESTNASPGLPILITCCANPGGVVQVNSRREPVAGTM